MVCWEWRAISASTIADSSNVLFIMQICYLFSFLILHAQNTPSLKYIEISEVFDIESKVVDLILMVRQKHVELNPKVKLYRKKYVFRSLEGLLPPLMDSPQND